MPLALLIASCIAAAAAILYVNRSGEFYYDEWIWYTSTAHPDRETLFHIVNGHLVLMPKLLYLGILETFGAGYLTFQLANLALVLASSVMLFVLARRRVGDWLALLPAVLTMFLGSGWDVIVSSIGINIMIAIACGLGAFLALERRTLVGDALAGVLILIGFASFSGTLPIALGCIVLLVLQGRWRRAWSMIAPILLFAIWRLQQDYSAEETVLSTIPTAFLKGVAAAVAAATGLFPPGFPTQISTFDLDVAYPATAVAVVALGYVLAKARPGLTPHFYAYATVAVSFWLMIAWTGRNPAVGRYNVEVLPFAFLALFELLNGRRLERRHWIAIGAVFALAMASNLNAMREGGAILRYQAERNRAILAALELHPEPARASRAGAYPISQAAGPNGIEESDIIFITPIDYLDVSEKFGSVSYEPRNLITAPGYAREAADRVLYNILEVTLLPGPEATERGARDCRPLTAEPPIPVPPTGLVLRTSDAEAALSLRRFADVPTAPPLVVPPRSARLLYIAADRLKSPWIAQVTSTAPVIACRGAGKRPRMGRAGLEPATDGL